MSDELNLEAERAAFEARFASELENFGGEYGGPGQLGWWYWDDETAAAWEEWQNRRTPIAAVGGDLPPPAAPKGPFADYSAEEVEAYAVEYARAAVALNRAQQGEPVACGMLRAADFIEERAAQYLQDNADVEGDTGSTVFHFGEAGRDYHSSLVELADDLRNVSALRTDERAQVEKYKPGTWFDARTVDEMQAFYLSRLPAIREAAKEHGYAIGLHGSERRDFDLIAMQWRAGASDKDTLARAIADAACGIRREGAYEWEQKPSGRFAVSIPVCWTAHDNPDFDKPSVGHIDLSVFDRAAIKEAAPADALSCLSSLPRYRIEVNYGGGGAVLEVHASGEIFKVADVETALEAKVPDLPVTDHFDVLNNRQASIKKLMRVGVPYGMAYKIVAQWANELSGARRAPVADAREQPQGERRDEFEQAMKAKGHRTERQPDGEYVGMTSYRWEGWSELAKKIGGG